MRHYNGGNAQSQYYHYHEQPHAECKAQVCTCVGAC